MTQRLDKFTGKPLVPIQVWVEKATRKALARIAKSERTNTQDILRNYIENTVRLTSLQNND